MTAEGGAAARIPRLILLLATAVVAIAGCGDSSDPAAADDGFVQVGMLDNSFTRDLTRIEVGDTVRFRNDGDTIHNAIAADDSWSTEEQTGSIRMETGEAAELTFTEEGVYEFYCSFHATQDDDRNWQGMVATLAVGDVDVTELGDTELADPVTEATGTTRRVPQDHPTIQNAVDAAAPGDLVLVGPGTWTEQVNVTTPSITIRGTDRHDVIIDGEFTRFHGINVVGADGVAVENLTVRNAVVNGVFFTGLTGYRTSYVTALNNGVYGIYAFDATDGLLERSYAAGSPDAGFYIGQCDPCNAVINDVVAEWNGLGYSGTNASSLVISNSVWRHNVGGIVPNTLDSELLPPAEDVTIVGNLVHDNHNREAPTLTGTWGSLGAGITLAGVNNATVARNRVVNHERTGIFVTPNLDDNFWMSAGNTVRDNLVAGSGVADLTLSAPAGADNCFSGNEVTTTAPAALQVLQSCDGPRLPWRNDVGQLMASLGNVADAPGAAAARAELWKTAPAPAADDQPDMPADAPVVPAVDVYDTHLPALDTIEVPAMPAGLEVHQERVFTMSGIPVPGSAFGVFYGLFGYILPFALYAAWLALCFWDVSRRDDLSKGKAVGWLTVVLLVPFLGPVLYLLAGGSTIKSHVRWTVVVGGIASYLVVLGIGAMTGGIV